MHLSGGMTKLILIYMAIVVALLTLKRGGKGTINCLVFNM